MKQSLVLPLLRTAQNPLKSHSTYLTEICRLLLCRLGMNGAGAISVIRKLH